MNKNHTNHIAISWRHGTSQLDVQVKSEDDAASDHHLSFVKLQVKLVTHSTVMKERNLLLSFLKIMEQFKVKVNNRYKALHYLTGIVLGDLWNNTKKVGLWNEPAELKSKIKP